MKKLLSFTLFLVSASVFAETHYTNFKAPVDMPAGLQNGSFNFTYLWSAGSAQFGGQVNGPYSLQRGLDDLNNAINTATFNWDHIFGTASLTLTCRNGAQSNTTVGPDIIKQPNQWITLQIPQGCD